MFGQTSGNTKLRPINATVWNAGIVWAPVARLSVDVDYLHWQINDEVAQQNSDQLLRDESACQLGQLPASSPTCVAAFAQVTRDAGTGQLVSLYTPKVNVSRESLDAFTLSLNYLLRAGAWGSFRFEGAWTDVLKHEQQQYAGDPVHDLLRDPYWSTDFKSKVNFSVGWDRDAWSTTIYVNRNGRTPNYLATLNPEGYATPGAGTLSPWTLTNLNVRYDVTAQLQVAATVSNLFNAMPPTDHSYDGTTNQPYNVFNYNPYGRSFRLEAKYRLGK